MPLLVYFSHLFTFNTVLEKYEGHFFLTINVYFYLTVPLCRKHNNAVYKWKAHEENKQFDLQYVEIGGEVWKLLSFFLTYSVSKNWQKNTTTVSCYVNELVSPPRTTGHLTKKKYQVIGHYCGGVSGVSRTAFLRVSNGGIRNYGRL